MRNFVRVNILICHLIYNKTVHFCAQNWSPYQDWPSRLTDRYLGYGLGLEQIPNLGQDNGHVFEVSVGGAVNCMTLLIMNALIWSYISLQIVVRFHKIVHVVYGLVAFLSEKSCGRGLSTWSEIFFCPFGFANVWLSEYFAHSGDKSGLKGVLLRDEIRIKSEFVTWMSKIVWKSYVRKPGQKIFLIRCWDLFHSFFRIKKRPPRIQHELFNGTLPLFLKICTIRSVHS